MTQMPLRAEALQGSTSSGGGGGGGEARRMKEASSTTWKQKRRLWSGRGALAGALLPQFPCRCRRGVEAVTEAASAQVNERKAKCWR